MEVAIFDDNSDDAATKALLQKLEAEGVTVYRKEKAANSKHGGLYAMMNVAIQYSIEQDYKYAYFVQDDMQFLWRDEDLEKRVRSVFLQKECMMCNANFLQKIHTNGIEQRLPRVEGGALYDFAGYGVADTGIIDVDKARASALHFPKESEEGNGLFWYNNGYKMHWLPQPNLAWVPWPSTYRYKNLEDRKVNSLHSLTKAAVAKLTENKDYAYIEDYTATKSWLPKPYWYANNPGKITLLKVYLKYYLRHII